MVLPTRAGRVGDLLTSWVDQLPPRLRTLLPRELVGFALIGGLTFLIDLLILASLRRWTALPLPVDVTIAYVTAFGLNFVLNRLVNFQSHAPVGGQVVRYSILIVADYAMTLGVTTGLTSVGIDFRASRLIAGLCVGVFTYAGSRWWVFRS